MPSYDWKALKDYCLLETYTTGLGKHGKILEIACLKVIDNQIVDTFHTYVNPKIHKLAEREKYKEYEIYPTMPEIAPKFLEFVKGFYLVGWNTYVDMYYLEKDGKFEYKKMVIDVYEPYRRSYKYIASEFYVKTTYEMMYRNSDNYQELDFENLIDCCRAVKQLYESQIRYNHFTHVELPKMR